MSSTVYLLLNTFPALSETFILNQVVGLLEKHLPLRILSLRSPDMTQVHPDFYSYNCQNIVETVNIPDNKFLRLFKGILLFLKLVFCCPYKTIKSLNTKRYRTAATSLKNLYLLNHLRKEKIDLLQAHFGPNGLVAAFLKDVGIIQSFIVTFHGSDINSYPSRYGNDVYQTLYREANVITANTRFTADKVIRNGADHQKIRIIPVGLSCEDYPVRANEPSRTEGWNFVTVGRLVEKKGHIWMVKALEILKGSQKDPFTWHIVGDGPLRGDIESLASELGLLDNIVFHGNRNAEEVRQHLQDAHIFILPSATSKDGDMEGQGLVLQEAQAMGVPVLSTLHNGIPDGVLDGESGILVPEKDAESLAKALIQLMTNHDLRASMGKVGAAFVRNHYDIPLLSQLWIELYKEISSK